LLKKAITIQPNNIKAHQNLMESYEKTNQFKELELAIENVKKFNKDNFIVKLYEGIIYYNNNQFDKAKKNLGNIFFVEPHLKNEITRIATLAKCYDRTGDYQNAFNYFLKANDLSPKIKKMNFHDKNRYLSEVEKRKNFFTQKNIQKWKTTKLINKRSDPVFLVGFPRSGTTLLDTILRSHPLVEVFEEKPSVNKLVNYLNKISDEKLELLKKISETEIETAKKIYFDFLDGQTVNKDAKIYIDKLPLNIIHIGEIYRIFPNSKFILSVRHPLDCVLSCFMQDFELNDAMANFLNLKDTAKLYDSVMKLWFQYISIFKINYHQVKYENLVNNFQNTVKLVFKFLGLPWDDLVLNYSATAKKRDKISTPSYNQVIKPLYSHADGRWKNYEAQMSNVYPVLNQWIAKFDY